jgi:hypothetical protein
VRVTGIADLAGVSDGTRRRIEESTREHGFQRNEKIESVPTVDVVIRRRHVRNAG